MGLQRERLSKRRAAIGKTLEDVAAVIGVTKQTVQKYESGVIKRIDTLTVERLADALDCSPAYLMGWTDDPIPQTIEDHVEPGDFGPDDVIYYKGRKLDIASLSEQDKDSIAKYIEFIINNSKNGG